MEAAELFTKCLAYATLVVKQVQPDHYANPTPDADWTARDLIEHMLTELSWLPDLIEGKTIAEVGDKYDADFIDGSVTDLSVEWQRAADEADGAVISADVEELAHLSYGDVTVEAYLEQAATDQLIHAWDLAEAIGMNVTFDADVIDAVTAYATQNMSNMAGSGLFGEPLPVSATETSQVKLLALFGRSHTWAKT